MIKFVFSKDRLDNIIQQEEMMCNDWKEREKNWQHLTDNSDKVLHIKTQEKQ